MSEELPPDPPEENLPEVEGEEPGSPGLRWKLILGVAALVFVLAVGIAMALFARFACVRHPHETAAGQMPLGGAGGDSVGGWVDQGDSIINAGVSPDSSSTHPGFDLWARAVAGMIRPVGDTLPGDPAIRGILDSLRIPGEIVRAEGDAHLVGITFRPRSAVRTRAPYLFYVNRGRALALPLQLDGIQKARFAGWHDGGSLMAAMTGLDGSGDAARPILRVMRLDASKGWVNWDSLPSGDSLGGPGSDPHFTPQPVPPPALVPQPAEGAPLLVVRLPKLHGPFDECPHCPHSYVDRVWRFGSGRITFLSEQPEDTPYSALEGFVDALGHNNWDEITRLGREPGIGQAADQYGLRGAGEEGSWRLYPDLQEQDSVFTAIRRNGDTFVFRMSFDGSHWRVGSVEKIQPIPR